MGNQLAKATPHLDNFLHDLQGYTFDSRLGKGKFLKTLKCLHDEGTVVVKVYYKHNTPESLDDDLEEHQERLVEILDIFSRIEFPHLYTYGTFIETEKAGYAIRQYMYANLYDRINTRPFLNHIDKRWITFQLLYGLKQCHSYGIYHGDIKSENVLVTSWNWVYITDFAPFKPTFIPQDNPSDFSYFFDSNSRRTCYLAPERFFVSDQGMPLGNVTAAMDIFSLGCVIAELFLEGQPIFDFSLLLAYINGEYDPRERIQKIEDRYIRDMVTSMIRTDPQERHSASTYLREWTGKTFPESFDTLRVYVYQLFRMEADNRINSISNDFEKILASVQGVAPPVAPLSPEKTDPPSPIRSTAGGSGAGGAGGGGGGGGGGGAADDDTEGGDHSLLDVCHLIADKQRTDLGSPLLSRAGKAGRGSAVDALKSSSNESRSRKGSSSAGSGAAAAAAARKMELLMETENLIHAVQTHIESHAASRDKRAAALSDEEDDDGVSRHHDRDDMDALKQRALLDGGSAVYDNISDSDSVFAKMNRSYDDDGDVLHDSIYEGGGGGGGDADGLLFGDDGGRPGDIVQQSEMVVDDVLELVNKIRSDIAALKAGDAAANGTGGGAAEVKLRSTVNTSKVFLTAADMSADRRRPGEPRTESDSGGGGGGGGGGVRSSNGSNNRTLIGHAPSRADAAALGETEICHELRIILNCLCTSLNNVRLPLSKWTALDLFLKISEYVDSIDILQIIVPFVATLLSDTSMLIRSMSISTLTHVLMRVEHVPFTDTYLFPKYLLPTLSTIALEKDSVLVRLAYVRHLPQLAQTARKFLEAVQFGATHKFVSSSSADTFDFDRDLDEVQTMVYLIMVELVQRDTQSGTDFSVVKRMLMRDVTRLCIFFGRQKTHNLLLPLIITFLNDRDWELRAAFFHNIVGVGMFVGPNSVESFIFPCVLQALTDDEEFVVEKAVSALASLCEYGLFRSEVMLEINVKVAPLLLHPNVWIRWGAVATVAAISKLLSVADVYCFLYPVVRHYLKMEIVDMTEENLLASLHTPMKRAFYREQIKKIRGALSRSAAESMATTADGSDAISLNRNPTHPELFVSPSFAANPLSNAIVDTDSAASSLKSNKGFANDDDGSPYRSAGRQLRADSDDGRLRGSSAGDGMGGDGGGVDFSWLKLRNRSGRKADMGAEELTEAEKFKLMHEYMNTVAMKMQGKLSAPGDARTSNSVNKDIMKFGMRDDIELQSISVPAAAITAQRSQSSFNALKHIKLAEGGDGRDDSGGGGGGSGVHQGGAGAKKGTKPSRGGSGRPSQSNLAEDRGKNEEWQYFFGADKRDSQGSSRQSQSGMASRDLSLDGNTDHLLRQGQSTINPFGAMPKPLPDLGTNMQTPVKGVALQSWRPKGVMLAHFEEHNGCINNIVASEDNTFFATASDDGKVKVWDCKRLERNVTNRSRLTYRHNNQKKLVRIKAMALCEGTFTLATGGSDGIIKLQRIECQQSRSLNASGSRKNAAALQYQPLSYKARTVSTIRDGKIYNVHARLQSPAANRSGMKASGFSSVHRGTGADIGGSMYMSEEIVSLHHYNKMFQSVVMSVSSNGTIRGFDLRAETEAFVMHHSPNVGIPLSSVIDPARNWLVTGSSKGYFTCWDLRFQVPAKVWRQPDRRPIHSLEHYNTTGDRQSWIVSAEGTNSISVWDVESSICRQYLRILERGGDKAPNLRVTEFAADRNDFGIDDLRQSLSADTYEHAVHSMCAPFDCPYLFTAGVDARLRCWDLSDVTQSFILADDSGASHSYTTQIFDGAAIFQEHPPGASSGGIGTGAVPMNNTNSRARSISANQYIMRGGASKGDPDNVGGSGDGRGQHKKKSVGDSTAANGGGGGSVGGTDQSHVRSRGPPSASVHHRDCITRMCVLERPFPMLISGDQSGVVKVWK